MSFSVAKDGDAASLEGYSAIGIYAPNFGWAQKLNVSPPPRKKNVALVKIDLSHWQKTNDTVVFGGVSSLMLVDSVGNFRTSGVAVDIFSATAARNLTEEFGLSIFFGPPVWF